MSHSLPAFCVDVSNFALVNYRVPADLVLRVLPEPYTLQTFDDDCFVSATCFCNGAFRPYGLPRPGLTFDESTFRTYVSHKGRAGVYFFGRYLSRMAATLPQRVVARHTYQADFSISVDRADSGYRGYSFEAASTHGEANFTLAQSEPCRAIAPFPSADEMAQFFTYRLHGFFTSSAGVQGHMPVSHPRMDPLGARLSHARFDLFAELGLVSHEEALDPHSVLIEPVVPFTLYAPRPLV